MDAIEVKNLRKSFSSKGKTIEAVKGISFNVKKGEILGLLGPNGAGKSTTINMLTGLVGKDQGTVRILGKDPNKDWEFVRNKVNVATAYEKLSDVLSVGQNLRIYGRLFGVKDVDTKIAELADMFGLKSLLNRRTSKLSSGENTRLILAKALINDPEVIFMDECTVGLDPDVAEKTRQIIKDFNKNKKCTILFTSHYMYEVEELCKRIIFMHHGSIIKIGTPEDIKKSIRWQTIEMAVTRNMPKLKQLLSNQNIEIINLDKNLIRFDINSAKHDLQKILNIIAKENVQFKDMHIYKATLDDFFIKIARRK